MRIAVATMICCLGLPVVGGFAPADAAERPQFPPSRDVTVTYQLTTKAEGAPETATLAFSATLQKLHAEGGPGAMIIDLRQHSMVVMMTQQRLAMRMPAGRQIDHIMAMGNEGNATRIGSDRVAGYACSVWRFSGKDGSGTGCITDDGVPLRGEGGDGKNKSGFEALTVAYGPQPAALFDVPPGFKQMEFPGGMGHAQRPAP